MIGMNSLHHKYEKKIYELGLIIDINLLRDIEERNAPLYDIINDIVKGFGSYGSDAYFHNSYKKYTTLL